MVALAHSIEFWLPVADYPGYEVSDKGRVRSAVTGRVLKQGWRRQYRKVCLSTGPAGARVQRDESVHALVLTAFRGPRNDRHANHINGIKHDNVLPNLEWVTPSENMRHAHRTGLQSNVGVRHSQAALNDDKVREIRRRLISGESPKEICVDYDVHYMTIQKIRTGENWSHVK